jgi:MSHA biogenesis protein MshO
MMRALASQPRKVNGGFTLVELVVVIVVSTIVVGFATMFMTTPVDAYFAQSRRADFIDGSDAIVRRMSTDLRQALPNSVRITNIGTRFVLEMFRYDQIAFYRAAGGPGDPDSLLNIGGADSKFSSLGQFADPLLLRPSDLPMGLRLAIGNTGVGISNAYAAGNTVISQANNQIRLSAGLAGENGEDRIELLNATFRFNPGSPSNRMFLVSGPVTYICNSAANARTLRRFANYTVAGVPPANEAAAQLNVAGVENTVIARDVAGCAVRCGAGAVCQSALIVEMQLARVNAAQEPLRVYLQERIDNST